MMKSTVNQIMLKALNSVYIDRMTSEEIHAKLQKGYGNIAEGKVQNAENAFANSGSATK